MKSVRITAVLLLLIMLFALISCDALDMAKDFASKLENELEDFDTDTDTGTAAGTTAESGSDTPAVSIDENGSYYSKDEVALYIHTYGKLPSNFITKNEAEALGWNGGKLESCAPGKAIGGDYFGNYEGQLPEKKGRSYTECDIDTKGAFARGAKRIVFSNDGLIYYTEDHYETFVLLYGDDKR